MLLFDDLFSISGDDDLFYISPDVNLFGATGNLINSQGTSMIYGNYSFSPVPLLKISKQYSKTNNQIAVGSTLNFTLNGTLIDLTGGLPGIIAKQRELRSAFNADGKYFAVTCNGTYLLEGYPRIVGDIQFDESSDNWTQSCPYVISIEFDNEPANENIPGLGEDTAYFPPYLQSVTENWDVQFDEQNSYYKNSTTAGFDVNPVLLRVTHNISAIGKSHYSGPGLIGTLDKPAWQQAKSYVENNLGFDFSKVFPNMSLAAASGMFNYYDHLRVGNTNESEGSYGVTETWVVLETGHVGISRKAIEDFTVEIRTGLQEEYNSVSIQGQIQGLEERNYNSIIGDFDIVNTRFDNASGYWGSIKDGLFIYPRVQSLVSDENITLHPQPLTKIVGKSPKQGIINYNYEFNDRPLNCITGAKFENITIQDENPVDVFSEIVVMGRSQGPIINNMNTVTSFRRNVNIDVLMSGRPGCNFIMNYSPKNQIDTGILCNIYTELINSYSNVVKTADTESWNPKNGRYNRSVSWTATDCNTSPDTTFC